jgi:hypothetical protein
MMILAMCLGFLALTGCEKSEPATTTTTVQYTCPMHREVVQNKPGKCPKCNMTLVEKH